MLSVRAVYVLRPLKVALRTPISWTRVGWFLAKELADRGNNVTYKFKKDDFYVISGVNSNGYEFYHKVFFYATYWVEFEITYPHSKHPRYDAWVERISHEFIPALPDNGQYDR